MPNLLRVTTAGLLLGVLALSGPVHADAPAVPDAPGTVEGYANGCNPGSLEVTWTAPADNGSPLLSYTVTGDPSGATTTVAAPATFMWVHPGSDSSFVLTATNAAGSSQPVAVPVTTNPCSGGGRLSHKTHVAAIGKRRYRTGERARFRVVATEGARGTLSVRVTGPHHFTQTFSHDHATRPINVRTRRLWRVGTYKVVLTFVGEKSSDGHPRWTDASHAVDLSVKLRKKPTKKR